MTRTIHDCVGPECQRSYAGRVEGIDPAVAAGFNPPYFARNGDNFQAHPMFSERSGVRKSRVAAPCAGLEQTREVWAREANGALERAGLGCAQ